MNDVPLIDFDGTYTTDSSQFVKIEENETGEILDFLHNQTDYPHLRFDNFTMSGRGEGIEKIYPELCPLARYGAHLNVKLEDFEPKRPIVQENAGGLITLTDSWVIMEPKKDDLQEWTFVDQKEDGDEEFLKDWPTFGVYDKLGVVMKWSGYAFTFGFCMGANAMMNAIAPILTGRFRLSPGASLAASLAVAFAPRILVRSIAVIVIGGTVGAAATSVPLLLVGTAGVFASAAVYHAFIAFKRSAMKLAAKAVGGTNSKAIKQEQPQPDVNM
eukprot:TRINITY_DN15778_c0_g1_i1.p1 TRINITY_DN15778_c0_g1~~TRINITY_DN15778_c0_g1_i1.p1  ORF type:complete len:301 (+),score=25.83 TRINITY_DN15778_c0_g1_i1:88-903(+)